MQRQYLLARQKAFSSPVFFVRVIEFTFPGEQLMKETLFIFVFGGLGALCRWGTYKLVKMFVSNPFPFGTLTVNVLGCLLFGVIMQMDVHLPRTLKIAATAGFLGAFTTFSTFGFESFELIKQGSWLMVTVNTAANCILGILAVWLGTAIGRTLA